MSAFIMEKESLATLAKTIESAALGGFNNYGFTVPDRLKSIATDKNDGARHFYELLYELNATADFFGSLTTDGALAYDRFTTATAYLNGFTAVLDLLELTPEELVELATEED